MSETPPAILSILSVVSVLLVLGGVGTALYDFYLGSQPGDPASLLFTAGIVTIGIGILGFGLSVVLTDGPSLRVAGYFVCGVGTSLYAVHLVVGELSLQAVAGVTIGSWVIATLLLKATNQ